MRRTKEEAEATKRSLLDAGLIVFSKKGYTATRVEDIAKQANVTTGAIYHHFGGKSDLYAALVNANSAKANLIAEQIVKEGGTPATVIRRLLVRLFEFVEEDEHYRAVVELFIVKTGFSPELVDISRQILESRRLLTQFFSTLIQEGIEAGEFDSHVSPMDTALALVGYMNGMGLIWVQDPEHFSIKQRAEVLIDTFLNGITDKA
jgi:AcrR family transcriptional regulator